MCFKGDNLTNDIPFMLFIEEQERKEREAETAVRENLTTLREDFGSSGRTIDLD